MRLYTIYDKVAKTTGPILELKNDAVAQRAYKQMIRKNNLEQKDYALMCIGELDEDECALIALREDITCDVEDLQNQLF